MLNTISKTLDKFMDKLCAYSPLITDEMETRPAQTGKYQWNNMPASKGPPGKGPQKNPCQEQALHAGLEGV